MRTKTARLVAFSLPLLARYAGAASLADFTPRVQGLTGSCQTVYNKEIDGCTSSDLSTGENCSVKCISGLIQIQEEVQASCADADVAETSIIGVFLLGKGPSTLCENVAATTLGGASSTTAPASSSSAASTVQISSIASTQTSIIVDTSSSSSTASSTTSTDSSTTTDATSTTSTVAATTSAAILTTESSSTASSTTSQKPSSTSKSSSDSDDQSGGGSPFDGATEDSSAFVPRSSPWFIGMGLALCGFLAQNVL